MISSQQLGKALYQLLDRDSHSHEKVLDAFTEYVKEHKLETLAVRALRFALEALTRDEHFETLHIVSGLPIDEQITKDIAQLLKVKNQASTQINTDKELIGGFVATYKGFQYDASIKHQLRRLQAQLITH